ncbi:MAG: hypothetical protein AAGA42_11650 [Actinomycetota bacterium]
MIRAGRPVGLSIAAVTAGALLAGCFTSTADFQRDAEDFIENNEELSTALGEPGPPLDFVSATCDEPANRDPGTTFECEGTDENDDVWGFEIVILDGNEYEVNVSEFP